MTKTETLKSFYDALNRNDIETILELLDSNIIRVEFNGSPIRGLTELKEHFHQGRNTWAEGGCHPKQFLEVANKVLASVHVNVRLKDKTEWIDGNVSDVFIFGGGKILEFHSFFKEQEALDFIHSFDQQFP